MKTKSEKSFTIEMVDGVEGPSLYLNNFRICGNKPWGGGTVKHVWKVDPSDIQKALKK